MEKSKWFLPRNAMGWNPKKYYMKWTCQEVEKLQPQTKKNGNNINALYSIDTRGTNDFFCDRKYNCSASNIKPWPWRIFRLNGRNTTTTEPNQTEPFFFLVFVTAKKNTVDRFCTKYIEGLCARSKERWSNDISTETMAIRLFCVVNGI